MRRAIPILLCCLAGATPAYAQQVAGTGAAVDQLLALFQNNLNNAAGVFENVAATIFWGLAAIEVVVVLGHLCSGAADFPAVTSALLWLVVGVGLFYFILLNGNDIFNQIVNIFVQAGGQASTAASGNAVMTPGDVFMAGGNIASALWSATWGGIFSHPIMVIAMAIGGLLDVVIFALIAAAIAAVIIEAWLASIIGILLLAGGGNTFTRGFSTAALRYAVSVGMKRMTMQIIVGLSMSFITQFAAAVGAANTASLTWTDAAVMIGSPVIILFLVLTVPNTVASMVQGSVIPHGAMVALAARQVAAAAMTLVGAVTGTGAALGAAIGTAVSQTSGTKTGGGVAGAVTQAAMIGGRAAGNFASAAAADVGQRMTSGSAMWRIARRIRGNGNGGQQQP
jgi:type IV secretion system protein TrbL